MSALVPFVFEEATVRVVDRDGEPWFVLADVCRVLDIRNPSDAAGRLDEDERAKLDLSGVGNAEGAQINDLGVGDGNNLAWAINESGLYSLILISRKDAAKRFKKWVTGTVLPSIRRTGAYGAPDPRAALENPAALRGLLLDYADRVIALETQAAEMRPKVEALDRIAGADGSLCITDAAKALQMRPKDLFAYLVQNGWIYKRAGGASYLGYQSKTTAGLLEHKVVTVLRADGTEKVAEQVLVTGRGLARLATLVKPLQVVTA